MTHVMTAIGAFEKRAEHDTFNTLDVDSLMSIPFTATPKNQAAWVLCSEYHASDARKHSRQREVGTFHLLAVDLDKGNIKGKDLREAIQSFTGQCRMRLYTSSSATKDERKWRALIPAPAMGYEQWHATTIALYRHLEQALGVAPDYALARAAQPIYLPNTAPREDGQAYQADSLVDGGMFDPSVCEAAVQAVRNEVAAADAAHAEAVREAQRRLEAARGKPSNQQTPIEAFNASSNIEDLLTQYGYKESRGSWRSPNQSTTSFATKVHGDFWTSLSQSDLEVGLGNKAKSAGCFGDAFDLFTYYEHGGDHSKAFKAAAEMFAIPKPPSSVDMLASRLRANQSKGIGKAAGVPSQSTTHQPKPMAIDEDTGECEFPPEPTQPEATAHLPNIGPK
jgi:hypothetical protein